MTTPITTPEKYFVGMSTTDLYLRLNYQKAAGVHTMGYCMFGCGNVAIGYLACASCIKAEIDRRATEWVGR